MIDDIGDEFDDDDDDTEIEEVDLKYEIINDDDSIYIKFTGFENKRQIEEFAQYIEQKIILLMHNSGTIH